MSASFGSSGSMKALVLAGGKGTRLRPLTYVMAKQLVPVANKPILHYAMDSLYQGGIRDFGIIISPETGEAIQASLQQWRQPDSKLTFIPQDEPAGLAHAVKIAQPYLGDDPFVMYLGDNLINAPLGEHIEEFCKGAYDASILLKPVENPSAFGVAERDASGHVVRLVEKPTEPKSDLALVGVYLFTRQIFSAIDRIRPSRRGELEITDAIQRLIDDGARVHARIHPGWWLDTGKKDDLLAANHTVLSEYAAHHLAGDIDEASRPEGNVSVAEGAIVRNSVLRGPAIIGRNCRLENVVFGPYASIGDDCVLSHCHIEDSVLLEGCHIDGVPGRIEKSLLGKGCRLAGASAAGKSHQFLLADHSEITVSAGT